MIFVSMIFFIFGFVTSFIITLSDPVKEAFNLSFTQAFLVNSAFFISFALFSIPAGVLVKRIGYKSAIVTGLMIISLAGFLFFPAIKVESYFLFLGAIFILSMGVVVLQNAANPYVAILGPPDTASGRLNFTQALNSIATWIAPLLIVAVILPKALSPVEGVALKVQPGDLLLPFMMIALLVLMIAFAIWRTRMPELSQEGLGSYKTVMKYRHMILGAIAVFFYVGAEVGVGTAISSYIILPEVGGGISRELALKFVGLYWAGTMTGRFFGAIELSGIKKQKTKFSFVILVMILAGVVGFITLEYSFDKALIFFGFAILTYLLMQLGKGKASNSLSIFAAVAFALAITSMLASGSIALWAIVSIGLFNSIMFPNIFALAVKTLDKSEISLAAGIINTMIVGGAVIPLLMGLVSDAFGILYSFIIPAFSYLFILYFALFGSKVKNVS